MRLSTTLIILSITASSCPAFAQNASTAGSVAVVDISNPANLTTTTRLITAPTVAAPGLTAAGVETCLGSAAGGLSLMGGGFTLGSTKVDEGCTIRLLARQLFAFGFQKAALALMCQDEHVAMAMSAAGSPCPAPPARIDERVQIGERVDSSEHVQTTAPAQTSGRLQLSFLPIRPSAQEEQAWFDRASNMN
jgi:hypothetical protein